ncbi:hypothetical protein G6011_06683 [Alternaria panax]|uniref:Uncharacterized protein n=1 Tax=Alternaria panax TaxID=48097 RepID=A0AAD4FI72_9PLEO|nr:hypothetical protein G6011_06683 [Alternaria panax]
MKVRQKLISADKGCVCRATGARTPDYIKADHALVSTTYSREPTLYPFIKFLTNTAQIHVMDDPNDEDVPIPPRQDEPLKEGEGRPSIKGYSKNFKFRPNGKVRIKTTSTQGLRGPYTISETHTGPKYTLEKSDGSSIDNGKTFDEDELEHAT